MINVAIWKESSYTSSIKEYIENLYNEIVQIYNGDTLKIVAIVDEKNNSKETYSLTNHITLEKYVQLYKNDILNALIVPVEHFSNHSSLITDIIHFGLSLENIYILKRLEGASFDSNYLIVNHIVPYLSARYLPYLEYHVADHCNLNCVACEHYSGLVSEACFPLYKDFEKEFVRLKELIDDIGTIRILGGEPLLNPELSKYLSLSRKLYPYSNIHIVTNGLLLKQMSSELINSINENRIAVAVSFYPPLISNIQSICDFLNANGITYYISPLNTVFTKKQTLTPSNNTDNYYDCFQAHCNNLYKGQMATCFLPFTTKYFNLHFGTSIPEVEAISIMDPKMTTERLLFELLQPIERCKYCTSPIEVDWDIIKNKNDLSSWLVEVPKRSRN